jgi:hypothetical protein
MIMGIWGLGIGDWGLGIGPNPQSPIPNIIINIIKFKIKNNIEKISLILQKFMSSPKFLRFIVTIEVMKLNFDEKLLFALLKSILAHGHEFGSFLLINSR